MSEEFDEDFDGPFDDENGCDYGVSEFCEDPQTKSMNLCTTECASYLKAVEEDYEEKMKLEEAGGW